MRGITPAVTWFHSLPRDEVVIIPGYVAMEVIWGTRDTVDQRQTERWLSVGQIVWLEPALCQAAYRILMDVHLKNAIGVLDMLVAQVALSFDLILHTFNQKHLNAVPGLKTIRPYTR